MRTDSHVHHPVQYNITEITYKHDNQTNILMSYCSKNPLFERTQMGIREWGHSIEDDVTSDRIVTVNCGAW